MKSRALTARAKAHGVHYTPPELASFLARVTLEQFTWPTGKIAVLDPACGDGSLLAALVEACPTNFRSCLSVHGFDTDARALDVAHQRLTQLGVNDMALAHNDFLATLTAANESSPQLRFSTDDGDTPSSTPKSFDIIITNPPYVRTQILGANRAQALAKKFQLTGRVDLYHAFVRACANALRIGGSLGLLTSNRFLSVQSGFASRRFLRTNFTVRAIYDLGDTKLFSAAVLPAIVVASKTIAPDHEHPHFYRIYERRNSDPSSTALTYPSALDALRNAPPGVVKVNSKEYSVERGFLAYADDAEPWALTTHKMQSWLQTIESNTHRTFGDVANIRVGIKTTADPVFIRTDWHQIPLRDRPEPELLHPIITHRAAARWNIDSLQLARVQVLYPHTVKQGRRQPIDLDCYPRARSYLELHREQLARREYVLRAGRKWFEIWVPQDPLAWMEPKIAFPDIAESPRFFLDTTGAIVNGDCYWITLRPGEDPRWLAMILAVANSSLAAAFYDAKFHNKLYAGRRRFLTQYVTKFPLPHLATPQTQDILTIVDELTKHETRSAHAPTAEATLNNLVWAAFGLEEEVLR